MMSQKQWSAVEAYIIDRLVPADGTLAEVLTANAAAGLPAIDVSPPQGKLLHLIARMIGARFILEIGTLGGYSTIWLARALPEGGKVVTLEVESEHARMARANFARTGVGDRVDLRLGRALETLPRLAAERVGPFDLVFIDADKPNNPDYLQWAVRMARSGAVIIGDNVVREGTVIDAHHADPSVRGIRRFYDLLAEHPRLSATAIQTVGSKGWDGFALAILD
jgi:predicted O-methyltransferase YrrM